MPAIKLPDAYGDAVVLTDSQTMVLDKKFYVNPIIHTYTTTNENVIVTKEELLDCPWSLAIRGNFYTTKFSRTFVNLSERAPHVKQIVWMLHHSPEIQLAFQKSPRINWFCKYGPILKQANERKLAFVMGTHARLGEESIVTNPDVEILRLICKHVLSH